MPLWAWVVIGVVIIIVALILYGLHAVREEEKSPKWELGERPRDED